MRKILIVLMAALAIGGCAGTRINWDQARKVQQGMSEREITDLLGKPYSVTSKGDTQIWVWAYANGMSGAHGSLAVPMQAGKVVSAPTIPASFR